jgi:hypothetical protein
MSDELDQQISIKRIERILHDLEYELARGLHQGYLDEQLGADIHLGDKYGKIWKFSFRLKEQDKYAIFPWPDPNKPRLVKGGNSS